MMLSGNTFKPRLHEQIKRGTLRFIGLNDGPVYSKSPRQRTLQLFAYVYGPLQLQMCKEGSVILLGSHKKAERCQ